MFEFLQRAILLFKLAQLVLMLPPFGQVIVLTQASALLNHNADGIPQQIDVSRKVHMRFDYKRIAAGVEGDFFRFFLSN